MLCSEFLHRSPSLAALSVAVFFASSHAEASKLKVVYSFCSQPQCKAVIFPGALLRDGAGNLYGAASSGRTQGVVFELVGGKKLKVLHGFPHDSSEGKGPGGLIIDVSGSLYGTTTSGGANNAGNVFELSPPPPGGKKWTFRVLYSFCAQENCTDGGFPSSGLTYAGASRGAPYDGVSPLFGETNSGGPAVRGTVYQVTPGEQGTTESVVYSFCSEGGGACTDGVGVGGGLLVDSSGNLFGTTSSGGNSSNSGVAFQLSQNGGAWTERVLYDFCSQDACKDGGEPNSALVQDASGQLYGTTEFGGRDCPLNAQTCGVMYELTPNGGTWQESVLYRFCAKQDCKDGALPVGGLLLDSSGNLFGVTNAGGGHDIDRDGIGGGVVFRYADGTYTPLYSFCKLASCADGEYPISGVIPDGAGSLLGTTFSGGPDDGGEVFRLTP